MTEHEEMTKEIRGVYGWQDGIGGPSYYEEFDEWLLQVKAEAWEEGHRHCFHVEDPNNPVKGNPYREAVTE